jgi:hypothetical protein
MTECTERSEGREGMPNEAQPMTGGEPCGILLTFSSYQTVSASHDVAGSRTYSTKA